MYGVFWFSVVPDPPSIVLSEKNQRSLETKKREVMELFAQITKEDVTLNNYISRSRPAS